MSGRATLLLFLAVLLLGGFIWFYERRAETTEEKVERARYALRIRPDRISRIHLTSPDLKLQLSRQGGGWYVTAPLQAAADDARVDRLLTQLTVLPGSQVITEAQLRRRAQKRADYGLDQPRWRILLGDRDSEMELLIGRDTPSSDALYLQVVGRRDVVVTSTNILAVMPAGVADFRSRLLLAGEPGDVARVELRSRSGFVQAARAADGTWQLVKPVTTRADSAAVFAALRRLFAARIVDFEASSKVGASLYGFDEPAVQCSVVSRDGAVEQTVLFGKTVEGRTNLVYATRQGGEEIFTADSSLAWSLALSPDELRDRRLLTLPPQRIAGIRIESADGGVSLARTNTEWFLTAPRLARADARKVHLALSEWTGARVRIFNDQPGTNAAALGLAPPAQKITFVAEAAAGETAAPPSVTYEVSANPAAGGNRALRIAGSEALLHVDSSTLAALPLQPLYFRSPDIFTIGTGGVRSLTFERGGVTNSVQLDASNAAPSAVAAALKLLQPLRARELVSQDAADLAAYGLRPPEASLTVGLAATGSLSRIVLLGRPAPGGGRYATVQGLDLVFTLDEQDAAGIEKLAAPPAP